MGDISVAAIGCIDFINQLKRHTKDLIFEPLVTPVNSVSFTSPYWNAVAYKPTPPSVSPYNFFVENFGYSDNIFIKVKRPNYQLRLIGLHSVAGECKFFINYYTAEGWKQTKRKVYNRYALCDIPEGYYGLRKRSFKRVTIRRKRPLMMHVDSWDMSSAEIGERTLQNISTILSLSWKPRIQRMLLNTNSDVGIDLSGEVVTYDCHTKSVMVHH